MQINLFRFIFVIFSIVPFIADAQNSLGLAKFVANNSSSNRDILLIGKNSATPILYDTADHKGVIRAINDLSLDFYKVSQITPKLIHTTKNHRTMILIGTFGKSRFIDELAAKGKINTASIANKWESFTISMLNNPFPGVDKALVIAGSDKRGTIYGTYELSEQLGVSPWYWWADVPVKQRKSAYAIAGTYHSGEPAVRYRGIFINDEAPAMTGWANEKFGGLNSKMYTRMFELLLRLRANYLWPAMWNNAFNEDDPENPRLADEYGIVMGTSHHEPMIRSQKEWKKHGKGPWNYNTNSEALSKFWKEGIQRNKGYESLITMGMRGDGDEPMVEGGDMAANVKLLEKIISDQREILSDHMNRPVEKIPQLWALYKEVKDYYDFGMKVPDDMTLLIADDNWGNIRQLPTAKERKRSGGAGIYYHFDYVGAPRNYKWLNTTSLPKVWEQMNLAHHYGANRIWIVNVGDLKPMELPIEFFMRMAWNPEALGKDKINDFVRRWAQREFGDAEAKEIAELTNLYSKYTTRRKPELLSPTTFSLVNYREAERVVEEWKSLEERADRVNARLPQAYRDSFFQLVLYPIKAMKTVTEMYVAVGKNRWYAKQGRVAANGQRSLAITLFNYDQKLSDIYNHEMANGKWNHMMDQTRIGYTSWNDPPKNILPKMEEVVVKENEEFGVAIDGSAERWPGNNATANLPHFESFNPKTSYIDVFAKGAIPIKFQILADSWLVLKRERIIGTGDTRIWVEVDWNKLTVGAHAGKITIWNDTTKIVVNAVAKKATPQQLLAAKGRFASLGTPIAFEASQPSSNLSVNGVKWDVIPGYGRGDSGMSIFPVEANPLTAPGKPMLAYSIFFPETGEVNIDLVVGPTLNFKPEGLKVGISVDDHEPQVLTIIAKPSASGSDASWANAVMDNARILKSKHQFNGSGKHTVKIWMVDPAVVLEKIVVYKDQLPQSYLGPVENKIIR